MTPAFHVLMLCVGLAAGFSLKKGAGQFQMHVMNPFQRVIKRLHKAQEAALYAEVSKKQAVRGSYDKRRGITRDNITEWVLNVAYTLRHNKFNGFDRRYEHQWKESGRLPSRDFYLRFPRPSLTNLHSAVADQCWQSLFQCLWYLNTVMRQMYTARRFDPLAQLQLYFKEPATVSNVGRWSTEQRKPFEKQLERHTHRCTMLHRAGAEAPDPFHNFLERFRWLTTATYFMCWYTQHQMPELAYFTERCDNYADCMESPDSHDIGNRDPRVRAPDKPFACALYSFCPEVCCPLRYVRDVEQCTESPLNPCLPDNQPGERQCTLDMKNNHNFDALIANYFNVTCNCPRGHVFSSYFRRCVDEDECYEGTDNCDRTSQTCVNRRGGFDCVCRYGYFFNATEQACRPSSEVRLDTSRELSRAREQAANRSLSERLLQIERDLRHNNIKAYLAWLPFDTSKVPRLGQVSAKFNKFRTKVTEFINQMRGMSAAPERTGRTGAAPVVAAVLFSWLVP